MPKRPSDDFHVDSTIDGMSYYYLPQGDKYEEEVSIEMYSYDGNPTASPIQFAECGLRRPYPS